jgi:hypothetical protein
MEPDLLDRRRQDLGMELDQRIRARSMNGERRRPTVTAHSAWVTWQADARGDAHRIGLLPSVRSRGAVRPRKTITCGAGRRDPLPTSASERQRVSGRQHREDHENGNEDERETAGHLTTLLCARVPELYSPHVTTT